MSQDKIKSYSKNASSTPIGTVQKAPVTLQSIQAALEAMHESNQTTTIEIKNSVQEIIDKNYQKLKEDLKLELGEMKEDIKRLDGTVKECKEEIIRNDQQIKIVEEKTMTIEERLIKTEKSLAAKTSELEGALMQIELDKSETYLRIQNVVETKDEKLVELVSEIFAGLGLDKDYVYENIEETYRIYTNYVRQNRLPGEIHVKLNRKSLKDEVLRKARDTTITFKGKEISILKQVPKRIRDSRKKYQFLTKHLATRNIRFRWLIPEGLLITWLDKKIKIDTIDKAREFVKENLLESERKESEGIQEGKRLEGDKLDQATGTSSTTQRSGREVARQQKKEESAGVETRTRSKK